MTDSRKPKLALAAKPEVTPWFSRNVKPVRPGPYETKDGAGCEWRNHFDGVNWQWGWSAGSNDERLADTSKPERKMTAAEEAGHVFAWRGLASNPKGKS